MTSAIVGNAGESGGEGGFGAQAAGDRGELGERFLVEGLLEGVAGGPPDASVPAQVVVGGILLAPVLILIILPVLIELFSRREAASDKSRMRPAPAE